MAVRTVYIDLDHASIDHTREGIEVSTTDDVVVLTGSARAFNELFSATASATCTPSAPEVAA